MMMLGEYLTRAAQMPWSWGEQDCCTFIADWAVLQGWPDPLAFLRGRYSTEFQAIRLIKEGGGLVELARRGMMNAGIPEIPEPRTGDIGIISRPTEDGLHQACAIHSDGKWVSLGISGIDAGPCDALGIWRVC